MRARTAPSESTLSPTLLGKDIKIISDHYDSLKSYGLDSYLTPNTEIGPFLDAIYTSSDRDRLNSLTHYLLKQYPDYRLYWNKDDFDLISVQLNDLFRTSGQLLVYNEIESAVYERKYKIADIAAAVDSAEQSSNKRLLALEFIEQQRLSYLKYALEKTARLREYLEHFNKSDRYTRSALSTVLNKDTLYFAQGLRYLVDTETSLRESIVGFEQVLAEFASNAPDSPVGPVEQYKLSALDNGFKHSMNMFFSSMSTIRELEELSYREAVDYYEAKNKKIKKGNTPEFLKAWSEYLAKKAARVIYKKLDPAKIDLSTNSLAKDGAILELFVLVNHANEKPKEYLISSFVLKDMGWNIDIVESVLWTHRFQNRFLATENQTKFKPNAGASLIWTYNGRWDMVNKAGEDQPVLNNSRLWTFLAPSLGVNVSFLNFTNETNFEIGAGPIIGLFDKLLFFKAGYNFSVGGEAPYYFGVGFSFTNIFDNEKPKTDAKK